MWTRIDLPRVKLFEASEPDGRPRKLHVNGYDYSVERASGDGGHRFALTVRLKTLENDCEPQMRWTESYEDEHAARCSVVRIIGAMPEDSDERINWTGPNFNF